MKEDKEEGGAGRHCLTRWSGRKRGNRWMTRMKEEDDSFSFFLLIFVSLYFLLPSSSSLFPFLVHLLLFRLLLTFFPSFSFSSPFSSFSSSFNSSFFVFSFILSFSTSSPIHISPSPAPALLLSPPPTSSPPPPSYLLLLFPPIFTYSYFTFSCSCFITFASSYFFSPLLSPPPLPPYLHLFIFHLLLLLLYYFRLLLFLLPPPITPSSSPLYSRPLPFPLLPPPPSCHPTVQLFIVCLLHLLAFLPTTFFSDFSSTFSSFS